MVQGSVAKVDPAETLYERCHRSYSVSKRAYTVKQPYGGYLSLDSLQTVELGHGIHNLNPKENVSPQIVGTAVEYLALMPTVGWGREVCAQALWKSEPIRKDQHMYELADDLGKDLEDDTVLDVLWIASYLYGGFADLNQRIPFDRDAVSKDTVSNVRILAQRTRNFISKYGPLTDWRFGMNGGYTKTVSSGYGDYITADGLYDLKVSSDAFTKEQTLQILMYWRMGLHSYNPNFEDVKFLGLFNARKNVLKRIAVDRIPEDVIVEVERDVIGYPEKDLLKHAQRMF